ncbi:TlpA family protein disulfide reductase [Bacteroidota bacterium]
MLGIIIILFFNKNKLNDQLSKMYLEQSKYDKNSNIGDNQWREFKLPKDDGYIVTFLEFGAKGCVACMKMEKVLENVKNNYPEINVIFVNVLTEKGKPIAKEFGIISIPCQVLLDNNGVEFYRHNGFLNFKEFQNQFEDHLK